MILIINLIIFRK